jgi:DNA repair protein RecN (Recombination protein N)
MLAELHLSNFVLAEDERLAFGPGFNAITGETGAGKSLIATALGIVLGASRFETRHIRKGADSARLTAVIELDADRQATIARDFDLDADELAAGGLVVDRRQTREGRGRIAIGGRPGTLSELRELGLRLVSIAAQDEESGLRRPERQREYLDRFGTLESRRDATASAWRRLRDLVDALEGGEEARRRRREELERLRYRIGELEALSPDPEADAALETRIAFLRNAARLREVCEGSVQLLYEDDGAAASRIGQVRHDLADLAELAPALEEAAGELDTAAAGVEEAVRLLRGVADQTEIDEGELEEAEDRRQALLDQARLHNAEVSELADVLDALRERVAELEGAEEESENLLPAIQTAADAYRNAALALRAGRQKAGGKLAEEVAAHFARLGMEQAAFAVRLEPLVDADAEAVRLARSGSAEGLDEVVFAIRPNPGEAWGTIAQTASGGEATRSLLAVRAALSNVEAQDVLFFDEIDAGVGGRLGTEIAAELAELARHRQVIAITHLPQVSARAATHLCVRKETVADRTLTHVEALAGEARIEEIASMIHGRNAGEAARQQAREMLGSTDSSKRRTPRKRQKKTG